MQARTLATQVLTEILTQGKSLPRLLPSFLEQLPSHRDQAFVQELCYGVLRWYHRLDFILQILLEKDLKPKDTDIKVLILLGLYQLEYLQTPQHAAVSATVEICDELHKSWAKKLVNALLRRYQRESEHLLCRADQNTSARYAHPPWIIDSLRKDFPDQWQTIINNNNCKPPMFLRVNSRQTNRSDYLTKLETANIKAEATTLNEAGIKLGKPVGVDHLPKFHEGHVSVQDLAAQLSFSLLDLKPGQRVLDACAAPGGKLAHILEQVPKLEKVVAVESDKNRFERLQQTLDRLQLAATIHNADVRSTDQWWDGIHFDRILLDAPCSASGIIRRHPDIKILKRPEDIKGSTQMQSELLAALWPLLKSGGKLLYATCSVLTAENDKQINTFTTKHQDAKPIINHTAWGQVTTFGRQILPGDNDMDGFYYASLEKT
ncbi:MAG: 16S rRNA (cytosine(967)-C(5))-methyltransferase RsmB [Gammaproteobacteria bacterium]